MAAFAQLIDNRVQLARVTLAVEAAIKASFLSHPPRSLTQSEVKSRFDKCARIFEELRVDCQWSIGRIVDHLPAFLRAELDGVSWKPEKRAIWTP